MFHDDHCQVYESVCDNDYNPYCSGYGNGYVNHVGGHGGDVHHCEPSRVKKLEELHLK